LIRLSSKHRAGGSITTLCTCTIARRLTTIRVITFGFSKEHRPDLKQLVHSRLCVDSGVPICSKFDNGNEKPQGD
jgi:transposase